MRQTDSLSTLGLPEGSFLLNKSDSLPHFFSETTKVDRVEIKRSAKDYPPIWMGLSFLFWALVIVFARLSYTLRLAQIFAAVFNPKQLKQLQREGNLLKESFPALLLLLFAFAISLLFFILINQKYPKSFYFSLGQGFMLVYAAVIAYHIVKFIAIRFWGILFETQALSTQYLLDSFVFHISQGLLLFPLLIVFIYSQVQLFLYLAIIVLVALWAYRFVRAISIGLKCTNYSRSYLFLYLCTLEVVPIFLLYKLSMQFV